MKYKIVCNQPGRLRLRFGKYIFTKGQCYSLQEQLLAFTGVVQAYINEKNGSVLLEFSTELEKQTVLDMFTKLSLCDIKEATPSEAQKTKELESHFKKRIIKHGAAHALRLIFLPSTLQKYYVILKAISFLRLGFIALRKGKLSVEVLDATAIGAAILGGNFKTASSTMFLLGLSNLLQGYANMRAKHALAESLAINVDKVWMVQDDLEIEVPMSTVCVGDILRIRAGSMVPADGSILKGEAMFNEATMTGEPLPVHKCAGGTVFAGTILEEGEVDICVRHLNSESRIAKIIELIDTGEKEKAQVQSKAEHLADDIVPISFGLFLATIVLTRNMARALSVLMVDFSCAIKLTTPLTIISALKECVNHDILIKGGKYLEILSKVDTVVFDKTGTLTNAVPKVSKIIVMKEGYTEDKVLQIAACLEEHFPHSVAASIVALAKSKGLIHPEKHGKVEYIVAHGIVSSYEGLRSIIGSLHFVFEDEGVAYPTEKETWINEQIGCDSAVYLAVDGDLVGILCVNDPPREDAAKTIMLLREQGIQDIIMITGDSEGSAKYASDLLGLDNYYAAVLPDGKAKIIEGLKAKGKTILMVGDGINDAPALSSADVSLTMNGSSDIAREVADISVISDDLTKIVLARKIANHLMKKIQQQYGFIVSFNTLLIALGLFGVITAERSAWLHNTSTIGLAANSAKPILPKPPLPMNQTGGTDNEKP